MLWAIVLFVIAVLTYLEDAGFISFLQNSEIPGVGVSFLSVALIMCALGVMVRLGHMNRLAEKEKLRARVRELEKKLEEQNSPAESKDVSREEK